MPNTPSPRQPKASASVPAKPAKRSSRPARQPSLAGRVLREYREAHGLSQEQLAFDLGIEPRSLRRYESGERALDNVAELRRITELLGIAPERLGIVTVQEVPRTPEQIDGVVDRVWTLIEASRMAEATAVVSRLLEDVRPQVANQDHALLRSLAHAHHAAGYVTAIGTRSFEADRAIPYYHEVEVLGRRIDDPTLITIGLTYQGDMHQRRGELDKALAFLQAARDTKGADASALGNGIQLLGRAYLRHGEVAQFERAMAQAEEMTALFDPETSSTRGHYSLGMVYEEYGRSYAGLGQMHKALDYLDRAQAVMPPTEFRELLIMTARAIALVQGGEIRAGIELAVTAAERCRATANVRFLDRIYIIQQYLDQLTRDIALLSAPLHDALHGGASAINY